jgi:hypothetical protein
MASAHALDLRDARSQIFDDAGFAHNIQKTRAVDSFAICSIQPARESSVGAYRLCLRRWIAAFAGLLRVVKKLCEATRRACRGIWERDGCGFQPRPIRDGTGDDL